MTKDEAKQKLSMWLDLAARNPTYSKWDELCSEAYSVLKPDEYQKIWDSWANGYVSCSDGYYRRR